MSDSTAEERVAVVLDIFPNGRSDGRHGSRPMAYALDVRDFTLKEVVFEDTPEVGMDDELVVEPPGDEIRGVYPIDYEDVSGSAQSELEYIVEELVEEEEERFVAFYNDAQPITLRLHQLNLLPGIGKKLRNNILDERKRGPFESFEDLEERVSGLHHPRDVLIERIMEELRDDDLKYKTFVRREAEEG
jgi:putative nucleotide binding protein